MGFLKTIHEKFFAKQKPLDTGVYHLRWDDAEFQARFHLRVNPGGEGLLMINASRLLHLNQSGAEMARYLLEEWPEDRIVKTMARRYRVSKKELRADLRRLQETIEMLAAGDERCPVSYLGVERVDPFSIDVETPYRMDVALTYGCDNTCAHCYNERPRAGETLATDDFKRVLAKLWGLGIPHVCFTGGEPTQHPDLVELVEYAEELGVITGVLTNGRKLADAAYMTALAEAGLDHVQITIQSAAPDVHDWMVGAEGAWEETVAGIQNAVASPVYTVTNTTITTQNEAEIEELVAFLASLGVEHMAANGLINSGGARDVDVGLAESALGPILERLTAACAAHDMTFVWYTPTQYCRFNPLTLDLGVKQCTAAKYNMCVEPNGDVLPCQSYYQPLGNILTDEWETIYNNATANELRGREYAPAKCRECPDLEICGAGCPLSVRDERVFCCPDAASNPA
ncbi:MAG: radical SAM protein [Candidatus Coatesbacteria bacterium]|nr:MAG: radical SAM protein [Candidatus Coatesbacteria bacterium]